MAYYKKKQTRLQKLASALNPTSPQKGMLLFAVVFAVIGGGYMAYRSFAANSIYDTVAQAKLKDNPARGLSYKGLLKIKSTVNHPCKGMFMFKDLKYKDGSPMCTAGPDPTPKGVDARIKPDLSKLIKEASTKSTLTEEQIASSTPKAEYNMYSKNIFAPIAPRCYGTGKDGYRVTVVYAYAGTDSYDRLYNTLKTYAKQTDALLYWSSLNSGTGSTSRRIRFEQNADCSISLYRVKVKIGFYEGDDYNNAVDAVKANLSIKKNHKYLIYYDYSKASGCGIADMASDSNPDPSTNRSNTHAGFAVISHICWGTHVEAHELMHNFGAVTNSAPHSTKGGHCWDNFDVMCYDDGGYWPSYVAPNCHLTINYFTLDCNKNDYFNTRSNIPQANYLYSHWNTANSPYLQK